MPVMVGMEQLGGLQPDLWWGGEDEITCLQQWDHRSARMHRSHCGSGGLLIQGDFTSNAFQWFWSTDILL